MTQYVLDSYALIALFKNEVGKELVVKLLKQAVADTVQLNMSSINIGELFYMLCRKNSIDFANKALKDTLNFPVQIHEPSLAQTLFAARLKAATRLFFCRCACCSINDTAKSYINYRRQGV